VFGLVLVKFEDFFVEILPFVPFTTDKKDILTNCIKHVIAIPFVDIFSQKEL